jgi:hypothetical protein
MARTSKQMERYNRLKEQGICVVCGKKEADRGVCCSECHEKRREYYLKYRHTMTEYQYNKQREYSLQWQRDNREYYNEYSRKWRAEHKDRCREYHREYMRRRRQRDGEEK